MISHFLNNHKFTMDIPFPFGRRSFQSEFIDQATHQQVEEFIQNILNKIAQQEVEINNITFIQWGTNIYNYGSFSFPTPEYSQTTLLSIQDSKKTRNNSSTESINHSLRLRLTHAHICSIGFKSGLYAGSQRILCPCCSNNS